MIILRITLPVGMNYNQAKNKFSEALRGNYAYSRNCIRIRPVVDAKATVNQHMIMLELGDPRDKDLEFEMTGEDIYEIVKTTSRLTGGPLTMTDEAPAPEAAPTEEPAQTDAGTEV